MNKVQDLSATSPAAASTVVGTAKATGLSAYDHVTVYLTTNGATGGTLNVTLQTSPDGTNWYDWFRSADIAAGASAAHWKICGALDNKVTQVGKNGTPALAKGTVAAGSFGDQMRVVYEAGASTSAGAAIPCLVEATFERHR
jgi:hypothetical protein